MHQSKFVSSEIRKVYTQAQDAVGSRILQACFRLMNRHMHRRLRSEQISCRLTIVSVEFLITYRSVFHRHNVPIERKSAQL